MTTSDTLFGIIASLHLIQPDFNTLARLTEPFGFSETALRSTLSRMVERDVLLAKKDGRKARYSLTKKGKRIGGNVSASFATPNSPEEWAGEFWFIAFTVPEAKGDQRYRIRKKLSAYRFGPWLPGLWIRPVLPGESPYNGLIELEKEGFCRLMRGALRENLTQAESAGIWRLPEKAEKMEKALELLQEKRRKAVQTTPVEAFRLRYEVGNEVVKALAEDPLLPPVLLPGDWPGNLLRIEFKEWDGLAAEKSRPFYTPIIGEGE